MKGGRDDVTGRFYFVIKGRVCRRGKTKTLGHYGKEPNVVQPGNYREGMWGSERDILTTPKRYTIFRTVTIRSPDAAEATRRGQRLAVAVSWIARGRETAGFRGDKEGK